MDFIKTESVQVFDIDKIKPGAIAMIHFYNGDRYGIITHVNPNIISVRCEDTVTRELEAKRVKNGKTGFASEEDVLVDIITPEEMHHIFDCRAELSNRLGAYKMYEIIEECASEGSIASRLFVKAYAKQTEDKHKSVDEDLSALWNIAEKSHDKAKNLWLRCCGILL